MKKTTTKYSDFDIKHLAKLANLPLDDKETNKLANELAETLKFIERIKKINTTGIAPTNQVTGLENVFRSDDVFPSLAQKEALSGAQATYKGFFKVKAVLEE